MPFYLLPRRCRLSRPLIQASDYTHPGTLYLSCYALEMILHLSIFWFRIQMGDERVGEDECDEEVVDSLPVGREEPAATVASIAKRPCSSTCGIHQRTPGPSTATTVIKLSTAKRHYSSTCGIPVFTIRIRKPLWMSFSALSQRLIMALLSHQLLRMPTYGNTKDGAVAVPRPMMRGTDIKTRYKANCTCGTVQRTI